MKTAASTKADLKKAFVTDKVHTLGPMAVGTLEPGNVANRMAKDLCTIPKAMFSSPAPGIAGSK
jgi:hypothetical protein